MTEKAPPLQHVAIIPDGNRRWAKAKGQPAVFGHTQAVNKIVPQLIDEALAQKIPYLTFWFFSTENWERSPEEVAGLMNLIRFNFDRQIKTLYQKNVRVRVIGRRSDFDQDIQDNFAQWEEKSRSNQVLNLTFALSYGGHDELVRAVNKIMATSQQKKIYPLITPELIRANLDTADLPDPDLIIRTSHEQRLSGFMSWQSAYSEFYFAEKNFPEFDKKEFRRALADFAQRGRRFGK